MRRVAVPIILTLAASGLVGLPSAHANGPSPTLFTYTGVAQSYTVPEGVTKVLIVALGGGGGGRSASGGAGAAANTPAGGNGSGAGSGFGATGDGVGGRGADQAIPDSCLGLATGGAGGVLSTPGSAGTSVAAGGGGGGSLASPAAAGAPATTFAPGGNGAGWPNPSSVNATNGLAGSVAITPLTDPAPASISITSAQRESAGSMRITVTGETTGLAGQRLTIRVHRYGTPRTADVRVRVTVQPDGSFTATLSFKRRIGIVAIVGDVRSDRMTIAPMA